jgi:phenylalanyl-tRNA synthetase beta subunit
VPSGLGQRELADLVWDESLKAKPENSTMDWSTIDIYQREDDNEHKQVTLRLEITSYERTLTDKEVNKLLDTVAEVAKQKFSAERI